MDQEKPDNSKRTSKYVTLEEIVVILDISLESLDNLIRSNSHSIYSFEKQDDHRLGVRSYRLLNKQTLEYEYFLTIAEDFEEN